MFTENIKDLVSKKRIYMKITNFTKLEGTCNIGNRELIHIEDKTSGLKS